MLFHTTPLATARLIELQRHCDDRGFFARAFCARDFEMEGLESCFVQVNNSFTSRAGTLRGLHYQLPPAAEVKIVRCVRGSFFDLILDLRPDSPTFRRSFGAILSAENRLMMYVPRGFAHAILTLEDDTEAMYFTTSFYAPVQERGLRWNDPCLAIDWPTTPREISTKDAAWPDFDDTFHGVNQLTGLM